jgi:hypothetical protein
MVLTLAQLSETEGMAVGYLALSVEKFCKDLDINDQEKYLR